MEQVEDTKTFTANIRCDFRYIAKIAKYLSSNGVFVGTKSKIASEAIRIIAHGIPDEFNVSGYGEALTSLRMLGYRDESGDKTGYFKELNRRIEIERNQGEKQLSLNKEALRLTKEFNEAHSPTSTIDKTAMSAVLAPTEDEIESESPQLKVRTSEDESKDIKKLRTAMNIPDGAPLEVLEENKTD